MANDLKNEISGTVQQVSLKDFLAEFDESVHSVIEERLARPGVAGVMQYVVLDMSSSQLGKSTAMIFGPGCTYKTAAEAAAGHLGDVPSRFQYPQIYYLKETSDGENQSHADAGKPR